MSATVVDVDVAGRPHLAVIDAKRSIAAVFAVMDDGKHVAQMAELRAADHSCTLGIADLPTDSDKLAALGSIMAACVAAAEADKTSTKETRLAVELGEYASQAVADIEARQPQD